MPEMPERFEKVRLLQRMDQCFNNPDTRAEALRRFRARTPDGKAWASPVERIALDLGILKDRPLSDEEFHGNLDKYKAEGIVHEKQEEDEQWRWYYDEALHVRKHWYTAKQKGGWWANQADVEEIQRQAMIQALELAELHESRVVDCYWACSGSDNETQVECFVKWNEREIILVFLTPAPPDGPYYDEKGEPGAYDEELKQIKQKDITSGMIVVKPNTNKKVVVKPAGAKPKGGGW